MSQTYAPAAGGQKKPSIQLFTPAARIVSGNVQKPNPLDMYGRPRDKPQYYFAVAFPKTHPACAGMFQAMHTFAAQQYQHFPDVLRRIDMLWTHGPKNIGFAYKFEDGDIPHPQKGLREGYAGCWIMKFTSTFPIRCCDAQDRPIAPEQVLTGYLVDVAFNVVANGKTDHTAGLFVNPVFVRLLSAAQPIVGGPQAGQVFAGRAAPTHELGSFRAAMQPQAGVPGMTGYTTEAPMRGQMQAPPQQQYAPPQQQYAPPPPQHHAPGYVTQPPMSGQQYQQQVQQPPMGNGMAGHAPAHQPTAPASQPMSSESGGSPAMGAGVPGAHSGVPGGQVAGNPTAPALPGTPASGAMSAGQTAAPGLQSVTPSGAMPAISHSDVGNGGQMNTGGYSHGPAGQVSQATDPGNSGMVGNPHQPAGGPAVPAGASAAPVHSTGVQPGSPIASPSEYQPHPQFVHGGQGA